MMLHVNYCNSSTAVGHGSCHHTEAYASVPKRVLAGLTRKLCVHVKECPGWKRPSFSLPPPPSHIPEEMPYGTACWGLNVRDGERGWGEALLSLLLASTDDRLHPACLGFVSSRDIRPNYSPPRAFKIPKGPWMPGSSDRDPISQLSGYIQADALWDAKRSKESQLWKLVCVCLLKKGSWSKGLEALSPTASTTFTKKKN